MIMMIEKVEDYNRLQEKARDAIQVSPIAFFNEEFD
jgi:hypothetical protein